MMGQHFPDISTSKKITTRKKTEQEKASTTKQKIETVLFTKNYVKFLKMMKAVLGFFSVLVFSSSILWHSISSSPVLALDRSSSLRPTVRYDGAPQQGYIF